MWIVAFGDSLTAGEHSCDGVRCLYAPYAVELKRVLEEKQQQVRIMFRGHPGWSAQQMLERAEDASDVSLEPGVVASANEDPLPIGLFALVRRLGGLVIVLLLAGTNDLAQRRTPEETVKSLLELHRGLAASGAATIAVGISRLLDGGGGSSAAVNAALEASLNFVECPKVPMANAHFSPEGSRQLGAFLGDVVAKTMATKKRLQVDVNGEAVILEGFEATEMARRFVKRYPGIAGAGCGGVDSTSSDECVVRAVASAVEIDSSATMAKGNYQFYLGKSLEAPLVIACSSLGIMQGKTHSASTGRYEFFKFLNGTFGQHVHTLYVSDPTQAWYLGGVEGLGSDPRSTVDGVQKLLANHGLRPSRTLVVGSSMGGFAALLFGSLLKASVLAMVPQTFVGNDRWPDQRRNALDNYAHSPYLDLIDLYRSCSPDNGAVADIFYGTDPKDELHARRLSASPCVRVDKRSNLKDHDAFTRDLRDTGELAALLRARLWPSQINNPR